MGKLDNPRFRARMTPTAANQHYQKQHDNDDDSTTSSQTKNGNHSKLGRKGDPRMHRSVAARLANPNLSLIEALRIGGFEYPEDVHDDHYILDKDTVSLGQRKNQLSRRCRLAKQQAGGVVKREGTRRSTRSTAGQTELEQIMSMEQSTDFTSDGRGQKRELTLPEDDMMGEVDMQASARQRIAKFHPQYHPIFVPPTHVSLGNIANQTAQLPITDAPSASAWPAPASASLSSQNALLDALRGQANRVTMGGSQSLLDALNHPQQQAHPSGVAVASLNATASSVGLTLEQLAVSLSSTTNLARVLADQTIPDMKQELALNLYGAECRTLYQRCMLLAGYDLEETQENSLAYKEFAYNAWSAEGKRLEKQVGRMDPPPSPLTRRASDEKVPAVNLDRSHSHKHAAAKKCCGGDSVENCCGDNEKYCGDSGEDRTCFDGRHVHRLEGKCGHKAIIHQPDGAPAHVDFVVNGKVECYEGIKPAGPDAAMWPSRYNCEELDCPTDSSPHKVACACENECTVRVNEDPKEFHLSDINLDGKEWDQEFFENNTGNENSLAGLIQLGSEDGKQTT